MERQIAGRDLERLELRDFASLRNTPALSPFEKVVFYEASAGEPSIEKHGFRRWTSGMHLREMVREFGLAATRGWMREQLRRNMYREWRVPERVKGIGSVELLRVFRSSAVRQIEGKREPIHEGSRHLHPRIEP